MKKTIYLCTRKNTKAVISKEDNILFAAEKLFAEKGFDATSTRAIATEANVNVSMISYYFGSKEKLFEKIFEFRMSQSLAFSKDVIADENLNEWQKLHKIIDRYTDRVRSLRTFYLIMQREQLTNKNPHIVKFLNDSKMGFLEIYRELIESGLERKVFTRRPRLEFLHSTVSGTIFTALNTMPVYKDFVHGGAHYESEYFESLKNHIHSVLKHLLGYDDKN